MLKNQLHIAHLIGSTGLYGAERWILALFSAMDPSIFKLTLINLIDDKNEKSSVVALAKERGFAAFDLYTGGRLNPSSVVRFARWAHEKNVAIIHGHGFKSDVIGLMAARLAGCKIVSTPHGWSLEENFKLQVYEYLDRVFLKFVDMVCPLSPDLMQGLEQTIHQKKLRLILNGVDINEIEAVPVPITNNRATFVLGYIGQLIERKDLSTLLRAVKYLVDHHVNLRLMIIGDGPRLLELMDESKGLGINTIVDFLGFRADVLSLLKSFDAFALPSRLEGIPRCIMEAMAAGIPVIASDIPGNKNLIIHGETGLLFSLGDSKELANHILYFLNNPEEKVKIIKQAREKIYLEFSNYNMARQYSVLYKSLCCGCPE